MIIILSPFDVDVVKTTLILNLDDVDIFSEHKAKLPFSVCALRCIFKELTLDLVS